MTAFHDLWADKYILLYPDGSPVARDDRSGGYPYASSHPSNVKFWTDLREAQRYQEMFKKEEFTIHRIYRLEILQERYTY